MDKSAEYVKMCEEAKEIQNRWIDSQWDYWICKEHRCLVEMLPTWKCPELDGNICIRTGNLIWLPTQSQLQAMLKDYYACKDPMEAIAFFSVAILSELPEDAYLQKCESPEQAWLAFVQRTKFNKLWNPETKTWEEK